MKLPVIMTVWFMALFYRIYTQRYSGNTDPALCCLHASAVVESLEPGESVTLYGWLGWSLDPVDLLCDKAIKALRSHSIS